jgi:hypothetical protein
VLINAGVAFSTRAVDRLGRYSNPLTGTFQPPDPQNPNERPDGGEADGSEKLPRFGEAKPMILVLHIVVTAYGRRGSPSSS